MKRVMVFGTFDIVHDGHRHLLREAAEMADEVIVVVARDEHVLELKGRLPMNRMPDRIEAIGWESEVTSVIEGDEELGTYHVILEHEPSAILFGYDQDELKENLDSWLSENGKPEISCVFASAYMPDLYNTTALLEQMQQEGMEVV